MELRDLSRDEALRLLGSVPIGRVVFTTEALPAVQPVNFVVDGDSVVIRIGSDGTLSRAIDDSVVAFQADEVDRLWHTGWSVTITGHAQEVRDAAEISRLSPVLSPWAPGVRDRFFRIAATRVTGRRLTAASPATAEQSTAPTGRSRP